jgi:hypothetical protein
MRAEASRAARNGFALNDLRPCNLLSLGREFDGRPVYWRAIDLAHVAMVHGRYMTVVPSGL